MGNKLINIRGTNGTGKSTLMKNYLGDFKRIIFETSTGRRLKVLHSPGRYILGDYTTDCGGIDTFKKLDEVRECVRHYIALGDVFMEGMMYSTLFSTPAALDDEITALGHEYYWVHIDVPVDLCIQSTLERRVRNGNYKDFDPIQLAKKWRSTGAAFNKAVETRLTYRGGREHCKIAIDAALEGTKNMFQTKAKVNTDIDLKNVPVRTVSEEMIERLGPKKSSVNMFDFLD